MNTKHTCGGPSFGRLTPGCPRCDELKAGAPARQHGYFGTPRQALRQHNEQMERAAIRDHFAPGGPHSRGTCGPVCTFGDW
jgi:hypothetical protein